MNSIQIQLVFFFCCLLAVGMAPLAHGQGVGFTAQEALILSLEPAFPAPGEQVTASLSSYLVDLSGAPVGWFVDGVLEQVETGGTSFSFVAGSLGNKQTIAVRAETENRGVFEAIRVLEPSNVTLIWEADTYTPPFYKGKPLASRGAAVRVTAFPSLTDAEGRSIAPQNLVYNWKKGIQNLPEQSGFGKQTLLIPGSLLEQNNIITVEIVSRDGTQKTEKTLVIPSTQPHVAFYAHTPLGGIDYGTQLDDNTPYTLRESEITVEAYPYFFSTPSRTDTSLAYQWRITGDTPAPAQPATLRLDRGERTSPADVRLSIGNTEELLQRAGSHFTLLFQ